MRSITRTRGRLVCMFPTHVFYWFLFPPLIPLPLSCLSTFFSFSLFKSSQGFRSCLSLFAWFRIQAMKRCFGLFFLVWFIPPTLYCFGYISKTRFKKISVFEFQSTSCSALFILHHAHGIFCALLGRRIGRVCTSASEQRLAAC